MAISRSQRSQLFVPVTALLFFYIIYLHLQLGSIGNDDDNALERTPGPTGMWKSTTAGKEQGKIPRSRVAMACVNTEETSFDHLVLKNKHDYAKKHGYEFRFDLDGEGFWHKYVMIENLINEERYDWIFWIDYDTLITNSTVKLENLISDSLALVKNPDQIDFILTPDCFPLNAGVMIFRAHPRVKDFLIPFWECHKTQENYSDQDCLLELVQKDVLGAKDRTVFIPQYWMNAFPEEIGCYDKHGRGWKHGMFVIHFAGAWAHIHNVTDAKALLMRKYEREIIW
ncbi:MAG: hypothetical protein M1816_007361 [Peltula sp. TS41687]|nr:MAG: hypothetical protein M1816_007361 [Peltula sp. TS41687]